MRIKKFHINNYRSLVDFKIEDFDETAIFYGLNNAGKSNILSALETIFKRKQMYGNDNKMVDVNFYEGYLQNFTNNFFEQNSSIDIDFSIWLEVPKNELEISKIIEPLFKVWPEILTIKFNGKIVSKEEIASDVAEIKFESIFINDVDIYSTNNGVIYFSSLVNAKITNLADLRDAFTVFIDPFNDCVYVIGSERDMHPISINHNKVKELTPSTFKQFLYSLYLSNKQHYIFEEINSIFSHSPFSFGSISFSEDSQKNLEIMIKESNIRLPIKQLGSGVLQLLYIITDIVYNKAKIVCIEELEQNLSPDLQLYSLKKLQTMIGSVTNQLIISSHSPTFLKLELSNTIYLIKKEDGKTILDSKIEAILTESTKEHFAQAVIDPDKFTKDDYSKYVIPYKLNRNGKYELYFTDDNSKLICYKFLEGNEWIFYGVENTEPEKVEIHNGYKHTMNFLHKYHNRVKSGEIPALKNPI